MTTADNDTADTHPQVGATTIVKTVLGEVNSTATEISNKVTTQNSFFQRVPQPDLSDFMTRLVEVATVTVASTDTSLSLVTTIDPWALFLANANVAQKTANFSLIRGTVEVVIVSALPGSCYGSYVWSALCDGLPVINTYDVAKLLIPQNALQVDNYCRIDCADSENCVLQLPFVYPYDFAQLPTGPAGMWALSLVCLSPIRSGLASGITTGHFRVYARLLPDYQLLVPHFQGKESRKGALVETENTKKFSKVKVAKPEAKGKFSSIANKVGDIAAGLSAVPVIGEFAEVASAAAYGASTIASWFGFTRDQDEKHPIPITMRSMTNVAHVDGLDSSDAASFTQSPLISIDPTMAGGPVEDCASFASLMSRWTLVKKITWATSATAATDLGDVWVSPFFASTQSTSNVIPTVAGYIGTPFEYWRGDMEYLVIIPASKLHRGSLQVYWSPYGSAPGATITNITMNTIIEVATGEEHQFNVGYARAEPFLKKYWITPDTAIINTSQANGCLRFRVVNQLVSQNSSGDVDILVFARGGKNMDFAIPCTQSMYCFSSVNTISDFYKSVSIRQGGAIGDEDVQETQVHELVPSSGDYPSDKLLFGESIRSVRALMQKPSLLDWVGGKDPTFQTPGIPFLLQQLGKIPGLNPDGTNGTMLATFNWFGWYRPLFTGIACSERYKIIAENLGCAGVAPVTLAFGASAVPAHYSYSYQTLAPMTVTGSNYGAEFLVPWYNNVKFCLGRRDFSNLTTTYTASTAANFKAIAIYCGAINQAVATAQNPNFNVYHSAGPDIRLTCFRQCPIIVMVAATQSASIPYFIQWS